MITGSAGTTGTTGADTFNATATGVAATTTYNTGDVLVGGDGADVLNIAATAAVGRAQSVVGIETINVNTSGMFTGASYDAAGVVAVGTTINLSTSQAGGDGNFTVTNLGTGATVAAAANVTGILSVTTSAAAAQSLTLTANSAATQTVVLTESGIATDAATISAAGAVGLTATSIETLNFSGNGAAANFTTTTLGSTANNLTGAQNVTLTAIGANVTGKTITDNTTAGTTKLDITGLAADVDLTKVTIDNVTLTGDRGAAQSLKVKAGQAITSAVAHTVGDITLSIDNGDTTYTTGAVTVELTKNHGTGIGFAVAGKSATADNITSLNLVNSTIAQTALEISATADTDVVLTGTKAVTLEAASTAKSFNASGLTAALTATANNTNKVITGGTGNDEITVATATTVTVNGGAGTDTLKITTDVSGLTASNFEVITLTGGVTVSKASLWNGGTQAVTGASNINISALDSSTIDLSGLQFKDATTFAVNSGSATVLDATKYTSTTGMTVIGSSKVDTIVGTSNADSITGGNGADVITGGLGADQINLTEGTAAVDKVVLSGGLTADTITGFTTGTGGDQIQLGLAALKTAGAIEAGISATFDLLDAGTVAITDTTATAIQEVADQAGGAAVAIGAGKDIFVLLEETYASLAALQTGLETGDHELTAHAGASVHDSFIVVWSDGTDSHVSNVRIKVDTPDFAAGDLVATDLAIIKGTGTITAGEFHADNFLFIA